MSTIQANRQAIKAAQALNFLIQASRNDSRSVDGDSVLKLVKLLWAADRYSMRSLGDTVTGDSYSALPYGPVASKTYDLIKVTAPGLASNPYVDPADAEAWRSVFERRPDHSIAVIGDIGDDHLSRADIMMLEKAHSSFRSSGKFNVANDISHAYPEWSRFEEGLRGYHKSFRIDMTDFFGNPTEDRYFEQDKEVLEAARFFYDERQNLSREIGIVL